MQYIFPILQFFSYLLTNFLRLQLFNDKQKPKPTEKIYKYKKIYLYSARRIRAEEVAAPWKLWEL